MAKWCNRLMAILVAVFGFATAVLLAVLVWREVTREKTNTEYTSTVLKKTYPGFFRTLSEQQFFQQKYINSFENGVPVNKTVASTLTCVFQCNVTANKPAAVGGNVAVEHPSQSVKPQRRRRDTCGYIYHGCCQSSVAFSAPVHHDNYAGVNRTLVQFDGARQYFAVHECSAYTSCSGCKCLQENSLYSAVVWKHGVFEPDDIDDTEIDFLFFDGCCKCVNV